MQIQNTYQNALQSLYNGGSSYQMPSALNQNLYQSSPMCLPGGSAQTDPLSLIGSLVEQITQLATGIMSMFEGLLSKFSGEGSGKSKGSGGITDLFSGLFDGILGSGNSSKEGTSSIFSGLFKAGASFFGF